MNQYLIGCKVSGTLTVCSLKVLFLELLLCLAHQGRIPTETSDSEVTSDVDVEPVKPSVQLALKDTTVTEGQSARLDCVIVGQPEPEVSVSDAAIIFPHV